MTPDRNKPVRLRNGDKVVVLDWDVPKTDRPIWARVFDTGGWRILYFSAEGHWNGNRECSDYDIINVPEKHERYMNVYGKQAEAFMYCSRSSADMSARLGRTECIRVEWEEGQYDE